MIIQFLQNSCKAQIFVVSISIKQAEFKQKISQKIKKAADEFITTVSEIVE